MKTIGIAVVPPWRESEHLESLPTLCLEAGITDLGYMIQCHPQSYPLMQKIDESLDRFRKAREALKPHGVGTGVLLQTTVDHGERYRPLPEVDFQRIVGPDGTECPACLCPADEGFLTFMEEVATRIAAAGAEFLLVDDDFRLSHHQPVKYGCFCDRHLAMFAAEYGTTISRNELVAKLAINGEEATACRDAWLKTRRKTYLDFARRFRAAIDAVDPNINAGFCNVRWNSDISEEMARVLAGSNQPFVRLNAGIYMNSSPPRFSNAIVQTAALRATHAPDIECFSEADTCPHNRYSLSASALRAYIVGTLLAGTDGPKLWIANCQEWYLRETDRYRKVLNRSKQYFEEVRIVSRDVEWMGPSAPHSFERLPSIPWDASGDMWNVLSDSPNWAATLLGRFGMPWSVRANDAPTMVAGNAILEYDEEDLKRLLAGPVLLDGTAAKVVSDRGYSELIGVEVKTGELLRVSHERFADDKNLNGRYAGTSLSVNAAGLPRLIPSDESVKMASWYVASPYYQSTDERLVSPAVTLFENNLGGRVAVYATVPGFGILATPNDRIKEQLIYVLGWLAGSPIPVWTVDTADALLRYGSIDASTNLLAVINLNPDEIEPLVLEMPGTRLVAVEHLDADSGWQPSTFVQDGDTVTLDVSVPQFSSYVARLSVG